MAHFRLLRDDGLVVAEFDYSETTTPALPTPVTNVSNLMTLAAIQAAINSQNGGTIAFAEGTYPTGRLTGKNGVWLYAKGPVNGLSFDMTSKMNWVIRGATDAAGFRFTGAVPIKANNARFGTVLYNVFLNVPSNGFDGAAVAMNGAKDMLVGNNDFTNCLGNVLGMYNMNNITFDGNHFTDCFECTSIQEPTNSDTTLGNNIVITKNVFLGTKRAAVEVGPASEGAEYFNGLVVNDNFFDDFKNAGEEGTLLAISLVGQASQNTTVKRNFIRRGNGSPNMTGVAIEFTGTGECSDNVVVNFDYTGLVYQSGWNVYDNGVYNDPGIPFFGWANNGQGTGTFGNVIYLETTPSTPPWPTRTVY